MTNLLHDLNFNFFTKISFSKFFFKMLTANTMLILLIYVDY